MDNKIYSSKYLTRAGILFFLAGLIILMGIITAEAYYPSTPAYTTHNSMISDLGATEPPNSVITQPSATIFNLSMILTGILILAGTFFLVRYNKNKIAMVLFGLFGLGVLGVGIFPGNIHPQHPLFAMLTFISGGLAAIYSYRLINSTFKFLALILGLITLFFLFTNQIFTPVLGGGGLERWVAYPIIIWMIGFGGYIAGVSSK